MDINSILNAMIVAAKSIGVDIGYEELNEVISISTLKIYKKKDVIRKIGDNNDSLGFLLSGLIRSYYIDEEGNESTKYFHIENSLFMDEGLVNYEKSRCVCEALEDCTVIIFPVKKIKEIVMKYDSLKQLYIAEVQNHYSLLSMSDEQNKIIDWCKKNNIIYFGYMILEQGALSGNYSSKHMFPLFSMRRLIFGKNKFIKINKLIEHIKNLAEVHSVKTSQIPIAWAIHKGIVPIIGLTKPEYVQALSEGVKVKLNDNEIMKLEKLAKESGVVCKGSWETNS